MAFGETSPGDFPLAELEVVLAAAAARGELAVVVSAQAPLVESVVVAVEQPGSVVAVQGPLEASEVVVQPLPWQFGLPPLSFAGQVRADVFAPLLLSDMFLITCRSSFN